MTRDEPRTPMYSWYQPRKWREAICAECLRNVLLTNGALCVVMAGVAWLFWASLRSPALIAGVVIMTTGVMIIELIRAIRWHRHD